MIRQLTTLSLAALVAGCAIQKAEQPPKPAFDSSRNPEWLSPDIYPNGASPEKEPVVRYGRYTLVSTQPDASQRDLMAQIIDVTIPSSMNPSVRDAMLYVVDRSGYALCPPSSQHVNILYTRPLPAAQYKLGPMTLRNTLQVLAGPAWQVKVDEVNRQVCFVLRTGYQLPPSAPAPQLNAEKPIATGISSSTSTTGVVVAAVPASAPISTSSPAVAAPVTTAPVLPPVAPAKDGSLPAAAPSAAVQSIPAPTVNTTKQLDKSKPVTSPLPAPAVPAPAAVVKTIPTPRPLPQIWTAEVGSTLRETVEEWAKKANWRVIWAQEDLNYPIEAPLRFEGSFQESIKQLFPLYDNAPRPFVVDGSEGAQSVLHVAERKKK
ncbi:pilus assembly protein PilL [Pseudomonas sp. CAH-1]|uniref:PFGI-1 class ICE element type IV pilus protein PilL2 n=1 Tax=Pseudomonas TaxID=286 RepID=UPI0003B8126E|nr:MULTISPECIES: TcpQ domain-containing protein [Pseudomonas]ERT15327.1 pilus assembly protein PilL [Pseudomonas putida SJ3]MBH3372269.1 TcpQ domain-containing protein [Pseudomonas juntendi]MBS6036820.1 TcpQ domain-containing protein [Pseudomonas sp.]MRT61188.1 pilus assembly protein PilL [Pseudomonas sp. CAH-1]